MTAANAAKKKKGKQVSWEKQEINLSSSHLLLYERRRTYLSYISKSHEIITTISSESAPILDPHYRSCIGGRVIQLESRVPGVFVEEEHGSVAQKKS